MRRTGSSRRRARPVPRARRAASLARAARLHPRRVGLPAADARRRSARPGPAAGDRERRRALPRSSPRRRGSDSPRRRRRLRSDRARDRGRAARCPGRRYRRLGGRARGRRGEPPPRAVDGRVRFVHGDLLAGEKGPFDLVVSNPPYVALRRARRARARAAHEPREALIGEGGHEAVARAALRDAPPGGALVLEVARRTGPVGQRPAPGASATRGRDLGRPRRARARGRGTPAVIDRSGRGDPRR